MAVVTNGTTLNILARVASLELESDDKAEKDNLSPSEPDLGASCSSGMSLSSTVSRTQPLNAQDDTTTSPIKYLEGLFCRYGIRFSGRRCGRARNAIRRPSLEEVEAYSAETALAVRQGDLPKLKNLFYEQGYSLSASNRFGESLLHICCRRGDAKTVKFMLMEAQVNPRVIDDMGRTAFHDVCWSSEPNLEAMDLLLRVLPPIGLLLQDCRGHTPLQYAQRKHWGVWLEFLQEREHVFVNWIRERKERAAALRKQAYAQAQNQQAQVASPPRVVTMVQMSPSSA